MSIIIYTQIKRFSFKLVIVILSLILMMHSPLKSLQPRNIYIFIQSSKQKIIALVSNYIHSNLFLYVHTLLILSFIIWIAIDIHSAYKIHKQSR